MQMTLQDIFLRGITYFYRLNAFLAGTGILSGILLRIFTGQHKASFAILAFGLSCFYIAIASKYLVHNWFLRGEPNPEYETKRRKWLVAYLLMGLPFWLPFGAIVTVSLFDKVYVSEFIVNRTTLFDTEIARFVDEPNSLMRYRINDAGQEKLVFKRNNRHLSSILYIASKTNKKIEKSVSYNPNRHLVLIDNTKYRMTVQSHLSRMGWKNFRKSRYNNHNLCQLFIPITLMDSKNRAVDPLSLSSFPINFLDDPQLNKYNLILEDNELRIDRVLEKPSRADSLCKESAYEYLDTKKPSSFGFTALSSAPKELQKHLIFPGILQGVYSADSYDSQLLVESPKHYLENVARTFKHIFNIPDRRR